MVGLVGVDGEKKLEQKQVLRLRRRMTTKVRWHRRFP